MTSLKVPRRKFLHLTAGAAALPFAPHIARAQVYPMRPVRIVVGFTAGSGPDIAARLIGQWLSERHGQSFVVENRTGAGGTLAAGAVARAPADGYTLLLISPASVISAMLYDKLNFNFIRDIAPVAVLNHLANVMVVHPAVPAKTIPEFVAHAKANPGKLNMASAGNGSLAHVVGELFKMVAGVEMVHVPNRTNLLTDLLAGQVQVFFGTMAFSLEYIRAGSLRALAVTTATRSEALPDVPTIADFFPGYEASSWNGIAAPKNTPAEIVEKLNREISNALADPKIRERLSDMGGMGGMALAGSPADFGKLITEEAEKWAKVIRFANIKPE
jgi:tripartite-type tricarboxylate transporter receptor subunit TctC